MSVRFVILSGGTPGPCRVTGVTQDGDAVIMVTQDGDTVIMSGGAPGPDSFVILSVGAPGPDSFVILSVGAPGPDSFVILSVGAKRRSRRILRKILRLASLAQDDGGTLRSLRMTEGRFARSG